MEQAVADAVGALPDFPGFDRRSWAELPCSHNGVDDPDYTNIEIRYLFSEEASKTELVQETYVDSLREYWSGLGYGIHRDDAVGGGEYHSLEARRDDGINLWYSTARLTALMVQSGCVPRSDVSELTYIPPAGGIVPGSEQDTVAHSNRYFPDGVPADQLTTPATDPFATPSAESPAPAGMVPWSRDPEEAESSPATYDGLL